MREWVKRSRSPRMVRKKPKLTKQPLEPVSRRFAAADVKEVPSFRRHVVPLLGKLGCNGRACHGSFQGRGGFRLSLFGYDFKADHEQLLAGDEPRVNPQSRRQPDPAKAHPGIPHEGGLRYKLGSWEHHVLLRWIQGGAVGVKDSDPQFVRIAVTPAEIASRKRASMSRSRSSPTGPTARVKTSPRSAGIRRNDEQIAKIDTTGVVTPASRAIRTWSSFTTRASSRSP